MAEKVKTVTFSDGTNFEANTSSEMLLARLVATAESQARTLEELRNDIASMKEQIQKFNTNHAKLEEHVHNIDKEQQQVKLTLYGPEGTGGLVKGHIRVQLALAAAAGILLPAGGAMLILMVQKLVEIASNVI